MISQSTFRGWNERKAPRRLVEAFVQQDDKVAYPVPIIQSEQSVN